MGLFDKIFQPYKDKQSKKALENAEGYFRLLSTYRPAYTSWQGCIYESELIRASIDSIARMAAKTEVKINGTASRRLLTLLKYKPNAYQTWYQFVYRVVTITEVFNTCFIVPVHDSNLDITGYYPVIPERVEILQYKGEPWLKYKFSNGNSAAVELSKCAIITKYQLYNDFFGETNTKSLESTLDMLHYSNESIKTAVHNTSNYNFIAQASNFSKVVDLANDRKRFTEHNLSADESDRGLLLFPVEYKNIKQIEPTTFTVDEKQRNIIQQNVFSYFGTNEDIIQAKATTEEQDAFYAIKIEPLLLQLSQVMTDKIFTFREKGNGNNIKFEKLYSLNEKINMAQKIMLIVKYMADYESVTGNVTPIYPFDNGDLDIQSLFSDLNANKGVINNVGVDETGNKGTDNGAENEQ